MLAPLANAEGLVPVNPVVNGDFDTGTAPGGVGLLYPILNQCIGVGHQVLVPLYSPWADYMLERGNGAVAAASAGDAATLAAIAQDTDPAVTADYAASHAGGYAAQPGTVYGCDPQYRDVAAPNPWMSLNDPAYMWSNDAGTTFADFDGDGDKEAGIPTAPVQHNHNLWQSVATATQAWSASFDAFEFTLESGSVPASANVQVGLSLTPGYQQSPWVGAFWEGAVLFRANDMAPDANGRVSMDPVAQGEIICPGGYTPCLAFKADYDAASAAEKETLLGQVRIVQTSFWSFNNPSGTVVIDDVAYVGAKTAVETVPNAGNV